MAETGPVAYGYTSATLQLVLAFAFALSQCINECRAGWRTSSGRYLDTNEDNLASLKEEKVGRTRSIKLVGGFK